MWAEVIWPFLPDPSNRSCFLSCSHWLEWWGPGLPWKPLVKDDRAIGLDHWLTVCSRATLQYGACLWTTMVNFCCVPAIRPLGCVGYSCLAYQTGFIPYSCCNKIFLGMELNHFLSSQGVTPVSVIDSGVTSLLLSSGLDSGRQLAP